MEPYTFIIQNKEIFKVVYALIVIVISILIVTKTHKLFKLSTHNGIRYFRNAFFFYGIAFAVRYFFMFVFNQPLLTDILFEYFLVMAGFFLLYSLLWKKFEPAKGAVSSLFNPRVGIFYALALIIVILDYLWDNYYFMFLIQILVFLFASIISYSNYKKDNHQHKFPKFYFIAMILGFFVWILNTLAGLYFQWSQIVMINVYLLNAVFFLLFLYGVMKVAKI